MRRKGPDELWAEMGGCVTRLFRLPPPSPPPHPRSGPHVCSRCPSDSASLFPQISAQLLDFAFAPSIAPTLVGTRRGPSVAPPTSPRHPLPSFQASQGMHVTPFSCAPYVSRLRAPLLTSGWRANSISIRPRSFIISVPASPSACAVGALLQLALHFAAQGPLRTYASPCVQVAYCRYLIFSLIDTIFPFAAKYVDELI